MTEQAPGPEGPARVWPPAGTTEAPWAAPRPPGVDGMSRKQKHYAAAGIALVLTFLVVIAATSTQGGDSGTASAPSTSAPSTAVVSDPPLESFSPTPDPGSDLKSAFEGWKDGGGTTQTSAIGTDFGSIGTDSENLDYSGLESDCTQLQTDVDATVAYGPIPVPAIQTPWAQVLVYTGRAANDCLAAVSTFSTDLLRKMDSEIATATGFLDQVNAGITLLETS